MVGIIFAGVGIVIALLVYAFGGNAGALLHKSGKVTKTASNERILRSRRRNSCSP